MLGGTWYYNKEIKVENVVESAKIGKKFSDVSGLWP